MNSQKVVTRFAPSPTGYMHVGSLRTALFAWLFAQKNNGTLILRIEDTDKEREVEGSIDHIIESLKWIGITWNEGPDSGGPHAPYLQSKRLESYKKYADILVQKGLAYADPYTSEELEVFRKRAEQEKRPFLYREHRPENPPAWDGTQPLRLKTTPISYKWNDEVRGALSAGSEAVDDFILIKSDGYPTYNFAHIIDDLEMEITHIFRADEFISSTPKFLALYEALGIKHPAFVTLPPIISPDGKKKLGKRDGAKDILEYRNEGILPEAMMNFLAFIGWNPGDEREVLEQDELILAFEISKIHVSGGKFNEEKLKWYNKEYLSKVSPEILKEKIKERLDKKAPLSSEILEKLIPIILERIHTFSDIDNMITEGELDYVFAAPEYSKEMLLWKDEKDTQALARRLEEVRVRLEAVDENNFKKDIIKDTLWDYATVEGRGQVLWPLRIALSGKEKSPDPFVLAELVGKQETVNRLKRAVEKVTHA
ncbi:glutamate--tRNA ligase [Patescibacteria group bacterium]|nr:glutamate--tRNA ligase [Patescibacteria group bacterium]